MRTRPVALSLVGLLAPESFSCRRRAQQVFLGDQTVEPIQTLPAPEHRHLAILVRGHVRIRVDRKDRVGFRPVRLGRPPDSREVEPVAVGQ